MVSTIETLQSIMSVVITHFLHESLIIVNQTQACTGTKNHSLLFLTHGPFFSLSIISQILYLFVFIFNLSFI